MDGKALQLTTVGPRAIDNSQKGNSRMSKKRLKTIGITTEVWKELKLMTIERDCTLDEAVAELLKKDREQNESDRAAKPAASSGKNPGQEPASLVQRSFASQAVVTTPLVSGWQLDSIEAKVSDLDPDAESCVSNADVQVLVNAVRTLQVRSQL